MRKNSAMKIVSVLLAIILWFYVASGQRVEIRLKTKIQLENLGDSLAVASWNTDTAEILFYGKSRDFLLMKILGREPVYIINLSTLQVGKHSFTMNKDSVKLEYLKKITPITVLQPKTFEIEIDSISKKEVIISPVITGPPADGFTLSGDILVHPERIVIFGAKSILQKISSVETDEISIRRSKKSFSKNTEVNIDSRFVKSDLKKVSVTISVDEIDVRDFRSVPVIFINKQESIRLIPDSLSVDIQLSGPKKMLTEMLAGEVSPVIDISHITSRGNYLLEISIPKRKYIEIISVTPASVKVSAE